eukprot:763208-Hanusia_phi.AAC.2
MASEADAARDAEKRKGAWGGGGGGEDMKARDEQGQGDEGTSLIGSRGVDKKLHVSLDRSEGFLELFGVDGVDEKEKGDERGGKRGKESRKEKGEERRGGGKKKHARAKLDDIEKERVAEMRKF